MTKINDVRVIVCWHENPNETLYKCKLTFNDKKLKGDNPILRTWEDNLNMISMKGGSANYGDQQEGVWVFDYSGIDADCNVRGAGDNKFLDCSKIE